MNKKPLFNNKKGKDEIYQEIINNKNLNSDLINHVNGLWDNFYKNADTNFDIELGNDYLARIWELNIGNVLFENNYNIDKDSGNYGPDFSFIYNHRKINIEAVCATTGDNTKDIVTDNYFTLKDLNSENFGIIFEEVKSEKIELRLQNSLNKKKDAFKNYQKSGIVSKNDINIIAISSSKIPHINISIDKNYGSEIYILRSLLPIGNEVVNITDIKDNKFKTHLEYKESNTKDNGAIVEKNIFNNEEYNNISAIIYCSEKYPLLLPTNERNIYIIKNPNADNKLESNFNLKEIKISLENNKCSFEKINNIGN